MIFSSLLFIYVFLPVSLLIYYIIPEKGRNLTMLLLSIIFCGFQGMSFLVFMAAYTLWNFLIGIICDISGRCRAASVSAAIIGIISDIAILLIFREELFFGNDLQKIAVPLGISFTTLMAIGYILDIAGKKIRAERNILNFALYMMFFPRLPMGPIIEIRAFRKMLDSRRMGLNEIGAGLEIFIKGLTKKVIFADNIFMLYQAVKSMDVSEISALSAWLGILSYALCLYFTLSGLADMGVGIARCFGFHLPPSFNYPVLSMGMKDFCSRWHMPVSDWFNRYIINPTYSKTKNKWAEYAVFAISWGIIGLWYDFRVNMLVWGLLIGLTAVVEQLFPKKKMLRATSLIYTLILSAIFLVFFFGDNMMYTVRYLAALIGGNNNIVDSTSLYLFKAYVVILLVCAYASTDMFRNLVEKSKRRWISATVNFLTPAVMIGMLLLCTTAMSYGGVSEMMLPIL
jgi:alginate O-acetyltransferase complex protein AlgI